MRAVPIAVLIVAADVLGYAMVVPLLPLYVEHFGGGPLMAGLVLCGYALCALLAAPLLGRWSDRVGRRPILLVSQFGSMMSYAMLALAPSLAWVFAARLLDGVTAGNVLVARAYVADVTMPQRRTQAFGMIAAAFAFGYMAGPLMAGGLATISTQAPFWGACGLSTLAFIATATMMPSSRQPRSHDVDSSMALFVKQAASHREVWQLLAFLLAFSCFTSGIALFCERRLSWDGMPLKAAHIAFILAYIGLVGVIVQLVMLPRAVARWSERRLSQWCLAIAAVAYAALGWTTDCALAVIGVLGICAIGNGLLRPTLQGLLSRETGPTQQGLLSGLIQTLQSAAMLVGAMVTGVLIELGWLGAWAGACAVLLGAGFAVTLKLPKSSAREIAAETS